MVVRRLVHPHETHEELRLMLEKHARHRRLMGRQPEVPSPLAATAAVGAANAAAAPVAAAAAAGEAACPRAAAQRSEEAEGARELGGAVPRCAERVLDERARAQESAHMQVGRWVDR